VTSVYCNINRITVGKKEVSSNIKIRIPKTVYAPTLLYDSESWTMLTKHESRITGTEMRHLRKYMGKTRRDRIRNSQIGEILIQDLVTRMADRRELRRFEHLISIDSTKKPRQE